MANYAEKLKTWRQKLQQFVFQKRSTRYQTVDQGIFAVTVERRGKRLDETAGAHDERSTRGHIPLVFWDQGECGVCQAGSNPGEFISNRAHRFYLEGRILKHCPLAAFAFAAAGQNQRALESAPLTGSRRRSIIGKPGIDRL